MSLEECKQFCLINPSTCMGIEYWSVNGGCYQCKNPTPTISYDEDGGGTPSVFTRQGIHYNLFNNMLFYIYIIYIILYLSIINGQAIQTILQDQPQPQLKPSLQ